MPHPISVFIVLDRSGSMQTCAGDAIGAVNTYLDKLRSDNSVDAVVSLQLFDSESIDVVRDRVSPADCKDVGINEFVPRGLTPLLDAVGQAVAALDADPEPDRRRLLVIMTDGEENASRVFTNQSLAALLKAKQDLGWSVIFLGANQDSWQQARSIGIRQGTTADFSVDRLALVPSVLACVTYSVASEPSPVAFSERQRQELVSGSDGGGQS